MAGDTKKELRMSVAGFFAAEFNYKLLKHNEKKQKITITRYLL